MELSEMTRGLPLKVGELRKDDVVWVVHHDNASQNPDLDGPCAIIELSRQYAILSSLNGNVTIQVDLPNSPEKDIVDEMNGMGTIRIYSIHSKQDCTDDKRIFEVKIAVPGADEQIIYVAADDGRQVDEFAKAHDIENDCKITETTYDPSEVQVTCILPEQDPTEKKVEENFYTKLRTNGYRRAKIIYAGNDIFQNKSASEVYARLSTSHGLALVTILRVDGSKVIECIDVVSTNAKIEWDTQDFDE